MVVPDRAIVKQTGSGEKFVYIYKDGKVDFSRVEIGQRLGDAYELLSTSISSPYSNSRVITDMFSRDFEVMCLRSFTALRLFSSGRVTFCSISGALAPE